MEDNKPVVPVVKTPAVAPKQSGMKKFWSNFFMEDAKSVKTSVVESVIKPSIKNGIYNTVMSALGMFLFGKNGSGMGLMNSGLRQFLPGGSNIVNYSSMYKMQNNGAVSQGNIPGRVTTSGPVLGTFTADDIYDPYNIQYMSWQDANNVYVGMLKKIGECGSATIKHLYQISKVTVPIDKDIVSIEWGWYDIPNHQIFPNGDYWVLKLPKPVSFKNMTR